MKTAFLDANVIFSAAYADHSSLLRLWKLRGVRLYSSAYALEEVRRNLPNDAGQARLLRLMESVTLVPEADARLIPVSIALRAKDRPILAAAIAAKMQFLVTGDARDFGVLFGKRIMGVQIVRPREFVAEMEKNKKK